MTIDQHLRNYGAMKCIRKRMKAFNISKAEVAAKLHMTVSGVEMYYKTPRIESSMMLISAIDDIILEQISEKQLEIWERQQRAQIQAT